ncbi:MAG: putative membrane protein YeaQ/YmgE (transglycosylase-associated protein family) [Gammaproteobacteria bacterium]
MPIANLILMLLIGIVFGGVASVILRGHGVLFILNILFGVIGASLGAFFPVLIGQAIGVEVSASDYLLRALFGAFLLVLLASLFRSAKLKGTD